MKPIGHYLSPSGIDGCPLRTKFFDQRRRFLPLAKAWADQVLILFLDGKPIWINVNVRDLTPA